MFTPEKQSQEYKYASALAYSLNMDRNAFLAMEPETSIEDDEDGNPLYSYKELLRRQYTKMYLGLPIDSLEKYLTESEFNFHFRLTKVRLEILHLIVLYLILAPLTCSFLKLLHCVRKSFTRNRGGNK